MAGYVAQLPSLMRSPPAGIFPTNPPSLASIMDRCGLNDGFVHPSSLSCDHQKAFPTSRLLLLEISNSLDRDEAIGALQCFLMLQIHDPITLYTAQGLDEVITKFSDQVSGVLGRTADIQPLILEVYVSLIECYISHQNKEQVNGQTGKMKDKWAAAFAEIKALNANQPQGRKNAFIDLDIEYALEGIKRIRGEKQPSQLFNIAIRFGQLCVSAAAQESAEAWEHLMALVKDVKLYKEGLKQEWFDDVWLIRHLTTETFTYDTRAAREKIPLPLEQLTAFISERIERRRSRNLVSKTLSRVGMRKPDCPRQTLLCCVKQIKNLIINYDNPISTELVQRHLISPTMESSGLLFDLVKASKVRTAGNYYEVQEGMAQMLIDILQNHAKVFSIGDKREGFAENLFLFITEIQEPSRRQQLLDLTTGFYSYWESKMEDMQAQVAQDQSLVEEQLSIFADNPDVQKCLNADDLSQIELEKMRCAQELSRIQTSLSVFNELALQIHKGVRIEAGRLMSQASPPAAASTSVEPTDQTASTISNLNFYDLFGELMIDPCVTPSGETYNRSSIEKWIRLDGRDPCTRDPLSIEQLYPNKRAFEQLKDLKTSLPNHIQLASQGSAIHKQLFHWVDAGNINKMRTALLQGGDPAGFFDPISGNCSLHIAAKQTDPAFLRMLCIALQGRSVDVINFSGETPLHVTAQHGKSTSAESLLDFHPDIDARTKNEGNTPLHEAVLHGHVDTCELLIRFGARTDIRNNDHKQPVNLPNISEAVYQIITQRRSIAGLVPADQFCFGALLWEEHFQIKCDLDSPVLLPSDINSILKKPCPFSPKELGRTIQETHLLILVPRCVGSKEQFSVDFLKRTIKKSNFDIRITWEKLCPILETPPPKSQWILITKQPVSDTTQEATYADKALHVVNERPYQVASILEVSTAILTMKAIGQTGFESPCRVQCTSSDHADTKIRGLLPTVFIDPKNSLMKFDGSRPDSTDKTLGVFAVYRL